VVDATHVTSCDHMGIRGIGVAYRRALRHNRRMRLIGAPPSLHRELTRLRLDHHLLDGDDGVAAEAGVLSV
jgi:anti-anti-sigma regulatory factor